MSTVSPLTTRSKVAVLPASKRRLWARALATALVALGQTAIMLLDLVRENRELLVVQFPVLARITNLVSLAGFLWLAWQRVHEYRKEHPQVHASVTKEEV